QAGSTFYASSGTVNTLAVNGALTLGNGVGSANQVLQTGIGGAPTWVSVPGASTLLSTTNTWTATQMYVSSIAVSAPGGIGVTYGVVAGSFTGNGSGITNLTGSNIVTGIPSAVLPSTVAYLNANQTWTAPQTYGSSITVNNAASLGAANQAVTISTNLVVSGAAVVNNSAGNSGQILSSQGPGTTPQWINPGSANTLLSSTNTWTATQMYVSSIAV